VGRARHEERVQLDIVDPPRCVAHVLARPRRARIATQVALHTVGVRDGAGRRHALRVVERDLRQARVPDERRQARGRAILVDQGLLQRAIGRFGGGGREAMGGGDGQRGGKRQRRRNTPQPPNGRSSHYSNNGPHGGRTFGIYRTVTNATDSKRRRG
jgi:hypothetical protein